MWQYRNNRLHGKAGIHDLARHSALDLRIEEELITGSAGMTRQSKHLIHSNNLFKLKNLTLTNKDHWLDFVCIGQKMYAADAQPTPAFPQERNFVLAWQQMLLLTQ